MSAADDRFAIHNALMGWAWAYDQKDIPMLGSAFADDAVFTLEIAGADPIPAFEGKEAVMGLFTGAIAEQTDQRRHVISNVHFEELTDTSARVTSYLTLAVTEKGELAVQSTGWYRDEFTKEGGTWLIKHRHLALDRPY